MEKIYTKKSDNCKLIKARPETVQFLLNYSKSLKITKVKDVAFETHVN